MKGISHVFQKAFIMPLPLSAGMMFDLFPAKLSPTGSNAWELKEFAVMHWVNYTQAIESDLNIL